MPQNFIFDWSGTLLDNFNSFSQIYDCIRSELNGPKISDDEIRKNYDAPFMKFWNKYYPDMSLEAHRELFTKYTHQVDEADTYPKVYETLKSLKQQGNQLFVLSSDPASKLLMQLKNAQLENLLQKVVTDVDDKISAIKLLVDDFSLDPQNTFYIGDTTGDIESGTSAGIKAIGITWGFNSKEALQKATPDFLIDDIIEMIKIVN